MKRPQVKIGHTGLQTNQSIKIEYKNLKVKQHENCIHPSRIQYLL